MKKITLILILLVSFAGYSQLTVENFEDSWSPVPATSGAAASDWLTLDNENGTTITWVQAENSELTPSYEGTTGTHAAFINLEDVTSGNAIDYLITPQFNVPSTAQLRFQSRLTLAGNQGTNYKIKILPEGGDPSDTGDYVDLITWTEGQINPVQTNYYEKMIPIPALYVGTNVRIAFVMQGDNMDGWLVDQVKVTAICVNPLGFTAETVSIDTVNLEWNDPAGASQWEIEIIPLADTPTGHGIVYSGPLPYPATGTASGLPLVQEPFTLHTDYKFFVRTLCDDSGVSNWIGPLEFKTGGYGDNCAFPLEFSTLPYSAYGNTGNYVSGTPGFNPGQGCTAIPILGYGKYGVYYKYTAPITGNIEIKVSDTVEFGAVFIFDECEDVGVNCLDGRSKWYSDPADLIFEAFPVIEGEDYFIWISAFQAVPTSYTLLIQEVTCEKPVANLPTGITDTSVNLSWTNPGEATAWELQVQEVNSGLPVGSGEYAPATNTGFVVNDLNPGTQYEYYIRASCGNGVFSPWAGPYRFYTSVCNASTQCIYTFEMQDIMGDKWYETLNVSQNGVVIATLSGPLNGETIATLDIAVCDGIPLQIKWNEGGAGYDFSQHLRLTVKNQFGQDLYVMPVPPYGGLQGVILYEQMVSCSTQLCAAPTGLEASNATQTTVDLSWDGPPTGNWEYYIVPAGQPAPTASTPGIPTTSNPVPDIALDASATAYDFYVRMVCEDGIFSDWSAPISFASAVCGPENTCAYTFVLGNDFATQWGGGYMTVLQQGVAVATLGKTFTSGDSQTVTVNLCDNMPFEIFWNKGGDEGFNYDSWTNMEMYNNFGQLIYSLPDSPYFSIGTTIYTGQVACDTMPCAVPTGLYTENATAETIDLGWDGLPLGNWEYYVVEAGSPAPLSTTAGVGTTTNPSIGVALETPGKNYEYYVRMVCPDSAEGYSAWAGPVAFHSQVCNEKCIYTVQFSSSYAYQSPIPTYEGTYDVPVEIYQGGFLVAKLDHFPLVASPPVELALCPGLDFEVRIDDTLALLPTSDFGFSITNPSGQDVFVYTFPDVTPAPQTVLFTGMASCEPATCLKPANPVIANITPTQVTLDWQETGDATSWQLWVLPEGQEPVAGTGGITVTEKPFVFGDDPGETLLPATDYGFFVMAICDDGNSAIAGAFHPDIDNANFAYTFYTPVINDNCSGAIAIPVNPGTACVAWVTGNADYSYYSGAVASAACDFPGQFPDIWYSFVATVETHIINFTSSGDNYMSVFEGGDCGSLTQIYCDSAWPTAILANLSVGSTYYIRISNYNVASEFGLCIQTATHGPVISVSDDAYTIPQLVDQFLLGPECGTVSNVTAVTGSNFGSNNGIGYFNKNGSAFPLEEGIILATGSISQAPGPWPGIAADLDSMLWPGDTDLDNLLPGADTAASYNASVIEFDFVPNSCEIAFDFVFASDVYGFWDCTTQNGLAIFLTGPSSNPQTLNLAVVPGTETPVSTATIRDNSTEISSCASQNAAFFGEMNYIDPLNSPTGYSGQTVALETSASVVQGQTYHLKIVIADQPAHIDCHNSAVFIAGRDCSSGEVVSLGADLTGANAICDQGEATLNPNLDEAMYDFVWLKDGVVLTGETSPTLAIDQNPPFGPGTYTVNAYLEGGICHYDDSILVEFADPLTVGDPTDLTLCSASGFATFDLSQNTVAMLGTNPLEYVVTYHISEADANNDINELDLSYTNVVEEQQIYARIESGLGCADFRTFNLIVQDLTPQFTIAGDLSLCEGTPGTLSVEGAEPGVTYSWTLGGTPLPGTASSITIDSAGEYAVTVNNSGCDATKSVTVGVIQQPDFNLGGPYIICTDEVVAINITAANFDIASATYTWSLNGEPLAETSGSIETTGFGTYTVEVTVGNCTPVTKSVEVQQNDINVAIAIDTYCDGNVFMLQASEQDGSFDPATATFDWSGPNNFAIQEQEFAVPAKGLYTIVVTTPEGCVGSASLNVTATNCEIQKGISPNNDGKNDTFDLESLDVDRLEIFNRYGQKVYGKAHYTNEWGGQTDDGDLLPTGTYYYVIARANGEQLTGWIYVIRPE